MKNLLYMWKRRNLRTAFLSICLCFFANTAFAKEIVMTCTLYLDGETHTRHLKYSNPIIGRKQINQRIDGKWVEWCRPETSYLEPCELTITNRGAIMQTVQEATVNKNFPEDGLHQGDPVLFYAKYILDFEFVTRRVEEYWTHMDGRSLESGHTSEKPKIDNWNCKRPKR